jgi:chromosome segregation ATPase
LKTIIQETERQREKQYEKCEKIMDEDVDELRNIIANFGSALVELEGKLEGMKELVQEQEGRKRQLEQEYNNHCSRKGRLEAEVETQRGTTKSRDKAELGLCKKYEFHRLAKALPLDDSKRQQFNRQMQEIQDGKRKELGQLKGKQQKAEDALSKQCSEQSAEIALRAKHLNDLNADRDSLSGELRKVTGEIDVLTQDSYATEEELQTVQRRLENAKKKHKEIMMEQKNSKIAEELDVIEKNKYDLNAALSKTRSNINHLKGVEAKETEIKVMKQGLQTQNEMLTKKLADVTPLFEEVGNDAAIAQCCYSSCCYSSCCYSSMLL